MSPAPTLSSLLAGAGLGPAGVDPGPRVLRLDHDSRACGPGSLFVAVSGFHVDGHAYAADAVRRGAVAVVAERSVDVDVPLVLVPDSRRALSALAAEMLGHPSRRLTVAGVTGTDGKTTTTTLLWAAWRAAGIAAGALTTVDWRSGDDVTPNRSRQTTLEAPEVQAHLLRLRDAGCTHVALETSSHALELHRVDDVDYRCAVYTRVTSEHLEVHGDRDRYLAAKARLAQMVSARGDGIAVLDAADPFGFPVLARIPVATRITYSADAAVAADLHTTRVVSDRGGIGVDAVTPWGAASFRLRLAGRFNAANAMAALAAACATGAPMADALRGLESLERVTGRMERVDLGQPFDVVVDYAHTAESLEQALREVRATTEGRLWVVFGSAGERDVEKRPAMGAVAARLADLTVITDEDPRGEDRYRILEEIAAGATGAGGARGDNVVIVPDRAEAIAYAIAHAAPGDAVLLAGKGHEGSIIGARGARPWDERAEAERAIAERLGA